MKERYFEFLNILMTRHIPVRNLHFFLTFLIEFLFTSVVLIVSIFTKNQMHNLSIFLIHITIAHLVIVLLAFLLFQKFSASKLLQSVPTTSYLFLHFEFLFLSSIFFEEQYLLIFFLFIGLSIALTNPYCNSNIRGNSSNNTIIYVIWDLYYHRISRNEYFMELVLYSRLYSSIHRLEKDKY